MPRRHRMESKSSPRRIAAVERQRQALVLRLAGADFESIAKTLGYKDRSGAYRSVMAALARVPAPEAKTYRQVNLERLNMMRLQYWQRLRKGDMDAMDMELKVQGREAHYLGLDAKEQPPGASREHPLFVQQTEAVDLSAASDADLDAIIDKARAIQEAGKLASQQRE